MKPKRRVLADGSRICRPTKYAKREDLPNEPDVPAVIFGLAECMEEPETSEYSASFPDATGRYDGDGALWCMNQAGLHIEAWFSEELGGADAGRRRVWRYRGDFNPARGKFRLQTDEGRAEGHLSVAEDFSTSGAIQLAFADGSSYEMMRVSDRATWSDRLVAGLFPAWLPLS
jgi:hypothetical protein